ncbi:MAG: CvpA family protein [Halanaerobium sp.]|nr:CvpA family protein [Halanaerobium sp.]
MPTFNPLDLAIIFIILLFTFLGYRKGAVKQTFAFLAFIGGLFLALSQYTGGADLLERFLPFNRTIIEIISFVFILLIAAVLINWLGLILTTLTRALFLGLVDHIFGAALGFVKGGILIYLLLLLLANVPYDILAKEVENSYLAVNFLNLTPFIQKNLADFFGQ